MTSVIWTGAPASRNVASSPPKPAPTITTRWGFVGPGCSVVILEAPFGWISPCLD